MEHLILPEDDDYPRPAASSPDEEDTYHPSNLAQALGGAVVTIVITLALYGGASILQQALS